jgi:hypothetical protein
LDDEQRAVLSGMSIRDERAQRAQWLESGFDGRATTGARIACRRRLAVERAASELKTDPTTELERNARGENR